MTRKISNAVARIKLGLQQELVLGDMSPKRDWGYAGDYVKAMWAMLQQDEPSDYVVATGETHSVEEYVELAFELAELGDWRKYVRQDQRFFRPAEVDLLVGDASKAHKQLGLAARGRLPGPRRADGAPRPQGRVAEETGPGLPCHRPLTDPPSSSLCTSTERRLATSRWCAHCAPRPMPPSWPPDLPPASSPP